MTDISIRTMLLEVIVPPNHPIRPGVGLLVIGSAGISLYLSLSTAMGWSLNSYRWNGRDRT